MTSPTFRTWQSVQSEVLRRIHTRAWKPGELIPNEADLAVEFGCARATVNRALRAVAETGLLDRRRKAGTRVAAQPVAKATIEIAVIRHEVEARGEVYSHHLIERQMLAPPPAISGAMHTYPAQKLLHLRALHLANGAPYTLENRWINTRVVPDAEHEPFDRTSANEWLLLHAAYTHGDIAFSALQANRVEAEGLGIAEHSAVLAIDRLTWNGDASVTKVRLLFTPGYQLRTGL